jgi:hypothetical protein
MPTDNSYPYELIVTVQARRRRTDGPVAGFQVLATYTADAAWNSLEELVRANAGLLDVIQDAIGNPPMRV